MITFKGMIRRGNSKGNHVITIPNPLIKDKVLRLGKEYSFSIILVGESGSSPQNTTKKVLPHTQEDGLGSPTKPITEKREQEEESYYSKCFFHGDGGG